MSIRSRLSFMKHGHVPRLSWLNGASDSTPGADCRRRAPGRGLRPATGPNGTEFFHRQPDQQQRLELAALKGGDVLRVVTENTVYTFQIVNSQEAVVSTNRADRPTGAVRLRGCTFGRSSSICADFLLCGANLEFLFNLTRKIYKTSAIKAIYWANEG